MNGSPTGRFASSAEFTTTRDIDVCRIASSVRGIEEWANHARVEHARHAVLVLHEQRFVVVKRRWRRCTSRRRPSLVIARAPSLPQPLGQHRPDPTPDRADSVAEPATDRAGRDCGRPAVEAFHLRGRPTRFGQVRSKALLAHVDESRHVKGRVLPLAQEKSAGSTPIAVPSCPISLRSPYRRGRREPAGHRRLIGR